MADVKRDPHDTPFCECTAADGYPLEGVSQSEFPASVSPLRVRACKECLGAATFFGGILGADAAAPPSGPSLRGLTEGAGIASSMGDTASSTMLDAAGPCAHTRTRS